MNFIESEISLISSKVVNKCEDGQISSMCFFEGCHAWLVPTLKRWTSLLEEKAGKGITISNTIDNVLFAQAVISGISASEHRNWYDCTSEVSIQIVKIFISDVDISELE
uniref:Uncharacterized protein n=1 Tax=Romanomermis culicivorax TaxID=13658 RepID=A0A915KDT4_ROMCU